MSFNILKYVLCFCATANKFSLLRYGELRITFDNSKVDISIPEKAVELKSSLGAGGRGMELSELSVYNGKLYTVDDRNGYY